MPPLRLVIFDDNRDFRESLRQLFHFTPNVALVGVFPDCSIVRTAIAELKPDVILMDIDMPGMNGIDATAVVKEVSPSTQVVMLTVSEEKDRIFQALRNGATGYLLKKASPDELIDSVQSVFHGGSPMSPAIARQVLQFFHLNTPPGASNRNKSSPVTLNAENTLTPREQEILEGLVDGLSYKMIAARFFISADTVKNHIQGIYKKLHVHSKGEAISYALKKGIAGQNRP